MEELRRTWHSLAAKGIFIIIFTQAVVVKSQFLTGDDGQPIDITLGRPNGPHLDIHSGGGQTEIDLDLGGRPHRPQLPEVDIDFGRPTGEIDLSGLFGSGSSGSSTGSSGSSSTSSESESSSTSSESESSSTSSENESSSTSESDSSDSSSISETEVTVSETSETESTSTSETENSDSSSSSSKSENDSSDTSSTTTSESESSSNSSTGSEKTSQGQASQRGGKKKIVKKGKRKVKKRRMWQSSFSQQSVRAGGSTKGTNSTGSGKKVKVVKRRLGWEQNMFSNNRPGNVKQSAARRELLQKRWNTAGERAAEPVGLKDVGVMSSRTVSTPIRATAKPVAKTATVVKKRKTQNRADSTRFISSAKSAVPTTRQQVKTETNKLKLGLKNPLSGKSTSRPASSRNRSTLPTARPKTPGRQVSSG